jgi:hypothetical protein
MNLGIAVLATEPLLAGTSTLKDTSMLDLMQK